MAEPARQRRRPGWLRWLGMLAELTKIRITSVVTLSVATGFILFAETVSREIVLPMLGTFLLACGSAVLNQVQEAAVDARMPRTRRRPIPSGRISRDTALALTIALGGGGLTVLASVERHTLTLLALGAFAVFWYNGVYLVLKRWTPFAIVPGSLIGAIPPLIGWVSAGGVVTDPVALTLAMFFFLWQIPHFWLLLMRFGDQYRQAGLPSLTATFSPSQLARITCVWILAVATCGILMATTDQARLPWNVIIVVASMWLGGSGFGLLRGGQFVRLALPAFIRINVYVLLIMAALVGNALM